jgi:hypothetical protein
VGPARGGGFGIRNGPGHEVGPTSWRPPGSPGTTPVLGQQRSGQQLRHIPRHVRASQHSTPLRVTLPAPPGSACCVVSSAARPLPPAPTSPLERVLPLALSSTGPVPAQAHERKRGKLGDHSRQRDPHPGAAHTRAPASPYSSGSSSLFRAFLGPLSSGPATGAARAQWGLGTQSDTLTVGT